MKSLYESALSKHEQWIETIRDQDGYHGPAVGPRSSQLGCCMPGFDWRYEGLLGAWIERHKRTNKEKYLDKIRTDIENIVDAQLNNGTFKNSHFTEGPFEGGMPHEPAMLNAAIKASIYLASQDKNYQQDRIKECVRKYVDEYLVSYLWNKLLRTFNNWPFSEFETYSSHCVATVIELLFNYGNWTGSLDCYLNYLEDAGKSILKTQSKEGFSKGAFSTQSNNTKGFSPLFSARCLPALKILYKITGSYEYINAFESAVNYVRKSSLNGGGFYRLTFKNDKPVTYPIMLGAVSGILESFHRSGCLSEEDLATHMPLLLREQAANGGFHTAVGFDSVKIDSVRDYRDFIPVCGWSNKTFFLLSLVCKNEVTFLPNLHCSKEVKINRKVGKMIETPWNLSIYDHKRNLVYDWSKKT